MQQHNSGAKLQHETFEWVDPVLINLAAARKRARGACQNGSGDGDECSTGNSASGQGCFNGNSAAGMCISGTGH